MALIKCPECGRENVSDSAEACPSCGFGIKEYIDDKKHKEELERKRIEEEKRKQRRFNELKGELDRKLQEIDNEPMPEEPHFFDTFKSYFDGSDDGTFLNYFVLFVTVASLAIGIPNDLEFFMGIGAIGVVIGIPFVIYGMYSDYNQASQQWAHKINNWEESKSKEKQKLIAYYKDKDNIDAFNKRISNITITPKQNIIKCPVCGSTNVEKISTASRAVSVGMVGMASSKIGKQYKCKSCKHMW